MSLHYSSTNTTKTVQGRPHVLEKLSGTGYSFVVTDGFFSLLISIVNGYNLTKTLLFSLKKTSWWLEIALSNRSELIFRFKHTHLCFRDGWAKQLNHDILILRKTLAFLVGVYFSNKFKGLVKKLFCYKNVKQHTSWWMEKTCLILSNLDGWNKSRSLFYF